MKDFSYAKRTHTSSAEGLFEGVTIERFAKTIVLHAMLESFEMHNERILYTSKYDIKL